MRRYPTAMIALALAGLAGIAARNDGNAQETAEPETQYVRIGHFQCRCRQCDFEANLQTVVRGLKDTGYGDSYLLDPNGQVVAGAGLYGETLMIYNLDLDKKYRNRHTWRSITSATRLNDELLHALKAARTDLKDRQK